MTRGEAAQFKPRASPEDSDRERTARPPQVPFEHMTRFVTRGELDCTFFQDPWTNVFPAKSESKRGNGQTARQDGHSVQMRRGSSEEKPGGAER